MIMKKNYLLIVAAFLMAGDPCMWAQGTGIHLEKSASFDYATQTGLLTLESFVEGETHTVVKDIPADILFVLDVSGSMQEPVKSEASVGWRRTHVLRADDIFLDSLDKKKPEGYYTALREDYHPVRYNNTDRRWEYQLLGNWYSLETDSFLSYEIYVSKLGRMMDAVNDFVDVFAAESEQKSIEHRIGIITYSSPDDAGTRLRKELTPADSGAEELKSIIYSFGAKGSTAADSGMQLAVTQMRSKARKGSYRAVIMLTDGEPNHGSGFDKSVANRAIAQSHILSSELGVNVYTIGVFDVAPDPSDEMFRYLEYLSSDYPASQSMDDPGEKTGSGYYSNASDGGALDVIFGQIGKNVIEGGSRVNMGSETVLKDIISNTFRLPENADVSDIRVFTSTFSQYDSNTGEYVFSEERIPYAARVEFSKDSSGGDVISVSNFDYSAFWCGPGNENVGRKLIVEIPFVPRTLFEGGTIVTNKEGSGLYGPSSDSPVETYPVPQISFYSMTISRTGLRKGENAVYLVHDNGRLLARVVLAGDGSGIVSKTLRNLPESEYTVTETSWNWAYDAGLKKREISLTSDMTLEFGGDHKDNVPLHDESMKTLSF